MAPNEQLPSLIHFDIWKHWGTAACLVATQNQQICHPFYSEVKQIGRNTYKKRQLVKDIHILHLTGTVRKGSCRLTTRNVQEKTIRCNHNALNFRILAVNRLCNWIAKSQTLSHPAAISPSHFALKLLMLLFISVLWH